jgi:hypothetical protein
MSWTGQFGPPSQPQPQKYLRQPHYDDDDDDDDDEYDEYGDHYNNNTSTDAYLQGVSGDQTRGPPVMMMKPAAAAARRQSSPQTYEYYHSNSINESLPNYQCHHHHHHHHHPCPYPHHNILVPSPSPSATSSNNNVLRAHGEIKKKKNQRNLVVNKKVAAVRQPQSPPQQAQTQPAAQQRGPQRPQRRLNGNPEVLRKYNLYLSEHCQEHNILAKVQAVLRALYHYEYQDNLALSSLGYAMSTMTKLDGIVFEGMRAAEKRCRKLRMSEVPFSPTIKAAGERVGLHGLILRYKKQQERGYGRMGNGKIRRLAQRYNVDQPLSVSLQQAESNYQQAMREYKALKPHAAALRCEFLQSMQKDPNQSDEYRQSIERMMQREESRRALSSRGAAAAQTATTTTTSTTPSNINNNNNHNSDAANIVSPSLQSSPTMAAAGGSGGPWDQHPSTAESLPTDHDSVADDDEKTNLLKSVDKIRRWCEAMQDCLETGLWPPPPFYYDKVDAAAVADGAVVLGSYGQAKKSKNNNNTSALVVPTSTVPAPPGDHWQWTTNNSGEWTPDRQWTSVERNQAQSTSA